jgi:DNA (cytosine-5)-methyltransferase 1
MATFYDFFAGGGMARAGLGPDWTCLFASDFDPKKGLAYQNNWGTRGELKVSDVRKVGLGDLPGRADLVWGSFPCQDLSLAGVGAGLKGERSGTFYPLWTVIRRLTRDGRAPAIIALENVCGALTSHEGRDFQAICQTFVQAGYRVGALAINADLFVPQSRPRLFFVGVRAGVEIDSALLSPAPIEPFHRPGVCRAVARLPAALKAKLLWWNLPTPERRLDTSPTSLRSSRPTSRGTHPRRRRCSLPGCRPSTSRSWRAPSAPVAA